MRKLTTAPPGAILDPRHSVLIKVDVFAVVDVPGKLTEDVIDVVVATCCLSVFISGVA